MPLDEEPQSPSLAASIGDTSTEMEIAATGRPTRRGNMLGSENVWRAVPAENMYAQLIQSEGP